MRICIDPCEFVARICVWSLTDDTIFEVTYKYRARKLIKRLLKVIPDSQRKKFGIQ